MLARIHRHSLSYRQAASFRSSHGAPEPPGARLVAPTRAPPCLRAPLLYARVLIGPTLPQNIGRGRLSQDGYRRIMLPMSIQAAAGKPPAALHTHVLACRAHVFYGEIDTSPRVQLRRGRAIAPRPEGSPAPVVVFPGPRQVSLTTSDPQCRASNRKRPVRKPPPGSTL